MIQMLHHVKLHPLFSSICSLVVVVGFTPVYLKPAEYLTHHI